MEKQPDLAILIVNFKARDLLQKCLFSLRDAITRAKTDEIVVWVVDNNSQDGSVEMVETFFPWVHLVTNHDNVGFAKANNQVLTKINSRFVLLLNPDTLVPPETLVFMVGFMDKYPKVGAATCRVELGDGQLDWASHRGFPTPWAALTYFAGLEKLFPHSRLFGQYHLIYQDLKEIHEIDSPSGAFFLARREVIDEVGMLDEDYFMYGEDIDWAYRIKEAGWKIMYVPEVSIIHYKGISSGIKDHSRELSTADQSTKLRSQNAFYETMKIFYSKHYANKYPALLNWLVMAAINLKWYLATRGLSEK